MAGFGFGLLDALLGGQGRSRCDACQHRGRCSNLGNCPLKNLLYWHKMQALTAPPTSQYRATRLRHRGI